MKKKKMAQKSYSLAQMQNVDLPMLNRVFACVTTKIWQRAPSGNKESKMGL